MLWLLAAGIFVVLAAAAVWLGGLNQDEGWYLYAANLVADGLTPYRDFFFTQGPVMPEVYSHLTWVWQRGGLLGARLVTLTLGTAGIALYALLASRLAPPERRRDAALITFLLLGGNLYHLYYLAIPKTYALASLLLAVGLLALVAVRSRSGRVAALGALVAGSAFAIAVGTRISLGALLAVVVVGLLVERRWLVLGGVALGALLTLALVYSPALDAQWRSGFLAAQQYHAARGGFDPVWTVGSLSRWVRWYLPLWIILGLGGFRQARGLLIAALAVVAVQLCAPFPYEDYQVPVMGILAAFAAVNFCDRARPQALLLTFGLVMATAFGSPLLEKWMTNGQDRFWPLKKAQCELAQLRETAREIERLDPGGKELFTQDLYLAVETGRRVPRGLEMGPFAMLDDSEWRTLIESAPCELAAMSGYTFAIEPPACNERDRSVQLEYWSLLKRHYRLVASVPDFGQYATPLLILKRQ